MRFGVLGATVCFVGIVVLALSAAECETGIRPDPRARADAERCALELSLCHARNASPCLPIIGLVEAPAPKESP
jgi:hypothetical protein